MAARQEEGDGRASARADTGTGARDAAERVARLALLESAGMDCGSARRWVRRTGSALAVWSQPAALLAERGVRVPEREPALQAARRRLAALHGRGIRVLTPGVDADALPADLAQIPDPPLLLYVRGALAAAPALAIVGSRRATVRGRAIARELAEAVARAGVTVVSGLAYGIDAAAHRGALDGGGHTVAVLASGLDRPSPAGNLELAREILARGGAWICEQPPGMPARPHHFPERNRLISGLASATLVVEARERSGSLWTARHALEQGRDVLVVPGPIDTDTCRGSNALLREGAAPVLEARDLLDLLRPGASPERTPLPAVGEEPGDPRAVRVLQRLSEGPCGPEELGAAAGVGPAELAALLLELELAGRIERTGARVARARGPRDGR